MEIAFTHAAALLLALPAAVYAADKSNLVPAGWDPALAGDVVMQRLVTVTAPQVKGAHDAEFVCVGDRAYVVAEVNDMRPGEGGGWPEIYCAISIVNLKTLDVEQIIAVAHGEQVFENVTLPRGACFVPRILAKDQRTLRCFFAIEHPGKGEAQTWFRDFDIASGSFDKQLHKAWLKTTAGTFEMQPRHFHADAAAHGFTRPAKDYGLYLFDSFKQFDGNTYVAINNFPGKQNALAVVQDDLATFEILGHYNEPQSAQLSESAVNRLPDGTWMAICRNDKGNYHFTTSADGKTWSVGRKMPHVPNGTNSKPTFDRFGGTYYLGWQENTRIQGVRRSVFNVEISRDGKTWERKYRFETPKSFQYPTFHEHDGVIWLSVTQGDSSPSRKERIMFGKLEDVSQFESLAGQKRIAWPTPAEEWAVMKRGVKLFTDRDYTLTEAPDYLAKVRAYTEAMIEHGRDTFGKTKSPLLLISIDPRTMTIPNVGSPRGLVVARLPSSFRHCANPHLDQNLYQIMYALSEITGDRKYAREADNTLAHFLNHCQEPRWGFFCWGEHFAWDVQTDAPLKSERDLPHEFQRPWILWERSFQLAPNNCKRFADCLWDHQIRHLPDGTISFSRHAMVNSKQTPSRTGSEYPRHGGFYIATWAEAYRQTGDRRMLEAIRALVKFFESRRHPDSGAIPAERHARSKGELMWPQSNLSLAVDLWDAAAKVPDDLARQMRNSARQIDGNFLRIPHEPGPDGRGFVKAAITSTLESGDVRAIQAGHDHGGRWHPWSRAWETGYGVPTDGRIAMLCYLRYLQVLDTAGLKELVVRCADRYLASNPPSTDNLVAGALGDVIGNLIAAHRLTEDGRYLGRAEHFADVAVEVFLSDGPLPKTTGKVADYCAASRCDTLMMQLLDLHLIRNRPESHVKLIYTDR